MLILNRFADIKPFMRRVGWGIPEECTGGGGGFQVSVMNVSCHKKHGYL